MSSPMTTLVRGRLFWAGKRFADPGLYLFTGRDNVRLIPWFKRQWSVR